VNLMAVLCPVTTFGELPSS